LVLGHLKKEARDTLDHVLPAEERQVRLGTRQIVMRPSQQLFLETRCLPKQASETGHWETPDADLAQLRTPRWKRR
jgi:hypothetical protein